MLTNTAVARALRRHECARATAASETIITLINCALYETQSSYNIIAYNALARKARARVRTRALLLFKQKTPIILATFTANIDFVHHKFKFLSGIRALHCSFERKKAVNP